MGENFSFGYWVRRRRKALDMTQAELGRRAGASAAMIRKIEADERRPSRELAAALAEQLAIPEGERAVFLHAAREIAAIPELSLVDSRERTLPPSNLPAPVTSLINRVSALSQVTALLLADGVRLLTVSGPPGMGKTRLAIAAARQLLPHFRDGAWFADLSAVNDAERVLPTLALALDLPPAPGLTPAQRVVLALGDKQLLLVLDNLEQVVAGAALDVAHMLRSCPRVKVLATSRVHLDIYGEHIYPLPAMTLPPETAAHPQDLLAFEAVQLFLDRARQYDPHFALTPETAVPVVQICRQMDGLPLALELAAARTRQMPVHELAAALREASGSDWHALLHTSARDLPPRQQTLFNAVAWSYSLLEPEEQAILRRLGVFEGDFDSRAATAVCSPDESGNEAAVRPRLVMLADHNLVSRASRQPDRWRLLEMIHEFALSQLTAAEYAGARRRHARHFAARLGEERGEVPDQAGLQLIDADLDNYRAALRYALQEADTPLAFQLAIVLGSYWERRGLLYEGRAALGAVLALPGETAPPIRFLVLHEAAVMAWMQQDFTAAEELSLEAMALTRTHQLLAETASLLNLLGRIYLEQARYEEAEGTLMESIALSHRLSPARAAGMEMIQRGEAALALGELDQAQRLTTEGLAAVTEEALVPYCMGWTNLAEVALARGEAAAARAALQKVLPQVHQHARRVRIFLVSAAGLLLSERTKRAENARTAVGLLAYVSTANERLGDPLSPLTQAQWAGRMATAESILSQEAWRVARDEAQHWTQEQALDIARQAL